MVNGNANILYLSTAVAAVVFAYVLGAQRAADRVAASPAVAAVMVDAPPAVPMAQVLTAGRAVNAGEAVADLPLGSLQVRADQLGEQFLADTAETRASLASARLLRPVAAGAPLLRADVDLFADGAAAGLNAALQAGLVAMSISVSPETAVAGLLRPGDRVDVIASVQDPEGHVQARRLISGSRVLAVDRSVSGLLPTESELPPATVTLEVTLDGATALSMARQVGQLSVVLSTASAMRDVPPSEAPPLSSEALMAAPTLAAVPAEAVSPDVLAVQVRRGNVPTIYTVRRGN